MAVHASKHFQSSSPLSYRDGKFNTLSLLVKSSRDISCIDEFEISRLRFMIDKIHLCWARYDKTPGGCNCINESRAGFEEGNNSTENESYLQVYITVINS